MYDTLLEHAAAVCFRGVLIIDVRQCQDLAAADWNAGSSDPYVLLKVGQERAQHH